MSRIGVILSGGGARGAYEAGVLQGLAEALGVEAEGRSMFQVVSGSSVGAINGAWLAANAHRADHDAPGLAQLWKSLSLSRHLQLDVRALLRGRRDAQRLGRSLLDAEALEALVEKAIDWNRLHQNIDGGRLDALIVSALHIGTGVTTLFTELGPGVTYGETDHPRRTTLRARIEAQHVLASAAIPALFPARRIGQAYFADGGLRFNTPISPALRAGAEKLVVVTLRHESTERPDVLAPAEGEEQYPSVVFLAGKVLNALLLDPVAEDLETLQHLNLMVASLEASLDATARAQVDAALVQRRGRPYRQVETLHLHPSLNIGVLAGQHLREGGGDGGPLAKWLLSRAAHEEATWEADLASYLLFDGAWAARLIELGRGDVRAQRDRVRAFFA